MRSITSPAKKGEEIEIEVDLAAGTHIAGFTWFNGTQTGVVEYASGNWWNIPASATTTMDTSKPLILIAKVVNDAAHLTITNNSSADLVVEYMNIDDSSKTTIATVVAGGTLTVASKLDTRGPIAITANKPVDIAVTAPSLVPDASSGASVQTWNSGNIQGDVTLTVTDPTP